MKHLLSFLLLLSFVTSCSIERRHYLPGYHVEGQAARGEILDVHSMKDIQGRENGDWRLENEEGVKLNTYNDSARGNLLIENDIDSFNSIEINSVFADVGHDDAPSPIAADVSSAQTEKGQEVRFKVHSPFSIPHSPLPPDTLKKSFKPQKQYREIDPIGKYSVITVLAGVALQKIVDLLAWFEILVPLSFGPGIFIPALIIAFIGLGLSIYSAYRVRKYPEKYKKNEWGKAALAILGWQILMTVLFAWLLS